MVGPINYMEGYQPVNIGQQVLGGLQAGAAIGSIENTAEKQRLALEQQRLYQADVQKALADPSPQQFATLALKYPSQREGVKQAWDQLSEGDRKAEGDTMAQAYSALLVGDPDSASNVIQSQITARKNAGLDTSHYENALSLVKANPQKASGSLGFILSHINDPKAFATQFGALGTAGRAAAEAPYDLANKKATAAKSGAEAQVAVETVPDEIQAVTEKNLTSASKRRIDELNVQIGQADSETKRGQLVLERDKLVADQAAKSTERGDTAQSQVDSAQHALDTIKELRASPLLKDTTGNYVAGVGTVLGKALGAIPGTENKDFRGQLESLKSQVFLPAVQQIKGMGALSNAEGEKLTAAVASLDADMKPESLKNAMGIVERYMTKGLQKGLAKKDVPTQGGGFVTNHPTFGAIKEGDINRLMKQYPGATREQVMQFLNQGGK